MKEMYEKYAKLLIDRCLSIKEKQPLFISVPIESIDFVRILSKIAIKHGVRDIHYEFSDEILKHNELMYYDNEDLFNSSFFNKSIYDEYAKKNAAFLMLCHDESLVMSDVDKDKMKYIGKINNNNFENVGGRTTRFASYPKGIPKKERKVCKL